MGRIFVEEDAMRVPETSALLAYMEALVARHAPDQSLRESVDICALHRGGGGPRGYTANRHGLEIGWWVHPSRYVKEMAFLLSHHRFEGHERILSVGCGPGFHEATLAHFFPKASIFAVDLDPKEVATAKAIAAECETGTGLRLSVLDARELDELSADEPFDLAISMAVLHDVPDVERALRGVSRLLVPGGKFLLSVNLPRRAAQFPQAEGFETILARHFDVESARLPLITPDDSLAHYGAVELRSREVRGYGLMQEAFVARARRPAPGK